MFYTSIPSAGDRPDGPLLAYLGQITPERHGTVLGRYLAVPPRYLRDWAQQESFRLFVQTILTEARGAGLAVEDGVPTTVADLLKRAAVADRPVTQAELARVTVLLDLLEATATGFLAARRLRADAMARGLARDAREIDCATRAALSTLHVLGGEVVAGTRWESLSVVGIPGADDPNDGDHEFAAASIDPAGSVRLWLR